jgi:hypothetical protein
MRIATILSIVFVFMSFLSFIMYGYKSLTYPWDYGPWWIITILCVVATAACVIYSLVAP